MTQNISALLTISEQEAHSGTSRVLTLPDGQQITVSVPPGAHDGQVIEVSNNSAPMQSEAVPQMIRVTLHIQPANAGTESEAEATFISEKSWPATERIQPAEQATQIAPDSASAPTLAEQITTEQATQKAPDGESTPAPTERVPFEPSTQIAPGNWSPPPPIPDNPPIYPNNLPTPYPPTPAPSLPYAQSAPGPYDPHNSQPPYFMSYPPNQPARKPQTTRNILLVLLALVILVGATGTLLIVNAQQRKAQAEAQATAYVNTQQARNTATVQAQTTGTAVAQATQTSEAEAYQQMLAATATAQVQATANAQATIQAKYPNPYLSGQGSLRYQEGMNNSQNTVWDKNDACTFKDSAYHAKNDGNTEHVTLCFLKGDGEHNGGFGYDTFKNFTFEVKMTILQGDTGGVSFRNEIGGYDSYLLSIGQEGYCQLLHYDKDHYDSPQVISGDYCPGLRQGLGQENTIGLVAQGNTVAWYVNGQAAGIITNANTKEGCIGLLASPYQEHEGTVTEVTYHDFKVWDL